MPSHDDNLGKRARSDSQTPTTSNTRSKTSSEDHLNQLDPLSNKIPVAPAKITSLSTRSDMAETEATATQETALTQMNDGLTPPPLNADLENPPQALTPRQGPFQTPEDGKEDYNAKTAPHGFYRIQGPNSDTIRQNLHTVTTESWLRAQPSAILIIPFFMAHNRKRSIKVKILATTFLKRAFPRSPNLIIVTSAAANQEADTIAAPHEDPYPWPIMVHNLLKEDAETILYYKTWFSKAFSFSAFPMETFVSDWIGNYKFHTDDPSDKMKTAVINMVMDVLGNKKSTIGKELAKLPQTTYRTTICNVNARPYNVGTLEDPTIYWAIYIRSPFQKDIRTHYIWLNAAANTTWYSNDVNLGELQERASTCRGCKGFDHSTYKCPFRELPFWDECFPNSVNKPLTLAPVPLPPTAIPGQYNQTASAPPSGTRTDQSAPRQTRSSTRINAQQAIKENARSTRGTRRNETRGNRP